MNESTEDLIGIISTLVSAFDELPAEFTCSPEISEILNYINTVCRNVVNP